MLRQSLHAGYRNTFACVAGPSTTRISFSSSRDVEPPPFRSESKPPVPKHVKEPIRDFPKVIRYRGKSDEDENSVGQALKTLARQSLRPAVLSARVKILCEAGGFEEAFTLLKAAPYGMQISVVWNTLISQVMRACKYDFAYSIYTEMKRRGMKPDLATYSTMLNGYAKIDDWSQYTKQLENCIAVHDHFYENRKDNELLSKGMNYQTSPTAKFFTILSKAGLHDKIFDIFNQMDTQGPWAPNTFVYGAILSAIPFRTQTKTADGLSLNERNASDAKLIWRQLQDAEGRGSVKIDDYILGRVVHLLSKGRPADQRFALEIVKEYAGFAAPGEEPQPLKVVVTPSLRISILLLLRKMQRSLLIMHYTTQLMEVDSTNVTSWARYVFEAFNEVAAMAPSNESEKAFELLQFMLLESVRRGDNIFRPTAYNYEIALMVCWRCGDWTSACEIFHLMTGYHANEFASPGAKHQATEKEAGGPKQAPRSLGLNLAPTNLAMLNLVRTAVGSKDRAAMLQCWNMYSYFFGIVPPQISGWDSHQLRPVHAHYFNWTFARYYLEMLDACRPFTSSEKAAGMESLRNWAQKTVQEGHAKKLVIPFWERPGHDYSEDGTKLKEAIDFEMQLRNNKSA